MPEVEGMAETLSEQTVIVAKVNPTTKEPTQKKTKGWLILADNRGIAQQLAQKLHSVGEVCTLVFAGEKYQQLTPEEFTINPNNPSEFEQVIETVAAKSQSLYGVVQCWTIEAGVAQAINSQELENLSKLGCGTTLSLVQALVKAKLSIVPRLWLATAGAQAVPSNHPLIPGVAQSSVWGMGKVISLEHPEFNCTRIDLDPEETRESQADALFNEIWSEDKEDQVAWRGEDRYVARLGKIVVNQTQQADATTHQPLSFRSGASYLITGGMGGLGLLVASWMVSKGAKHLVLLGRRSPDDATRNKITQLEMAGAEVVVEKADVSDWESMRGVWQRIDSSNRPLAGVIHSAGMLSDGVLQNQSWSSFEEVMAPKVQGAWHLHQLSQNQSLDFFVLFSSVASLLGSPGQGNYSAANGFLDGLAHYRRAMGLPGLSINWGVWSESGIAARLASQYQNRMKTSGMGSISPTEGLQVLEQLLQTHTIQVGVLPADWSVLAKQWSLENQSSLLWEFLQQETTPKNPDEQILDKWKAAPTTERQEILRSYIQSLVAKSMGINSSEISTDANLIELGMDSLMSMEVVNQLSRDLNFIIYPREFYERPKIRSLTQYLSAELNNNDVTHQSSSKSIEIFETKSISEPPPLASNSERLPGIIFILSSPRSGSTLLRVMLAGHSSVFSPPELHLLPFNTMKERQEQLNASYLGEGLQKALMEIQNLDATASQTLIQDMESQNLSIQQVYRMLQENIAPRLLVDKSPSYGMNRTVLERAEAIFANSKYIYLVRHPYSVIESFVRMRMQKLLGFGNEDPYQIAEQVWVKSNQNILDFLTGLESERYHQIHYEKLVKEPEKVLSQLCDFLNIDFQPELLQPYQGDRMTEGVHQTSLSINDPNFLQHNTIDQNLADKWKTIQLPHSLGEEAQHIANQLNYELPHTNKQEYSVTAVTEQVIRSEKFIEFRGNQICLCSWGAANAPVVLCIHGLLDQGLVWQEVALPLVAKGYRVVAPDLFGHGRSSHLEMVTSYNLLTFLAQIDRVIQELSDQPLLLVGHSMGAMLATAIASVLPEKIKRLILVELPLPAEENKQESRVNQLTTCLEYMNSTPQHPTFPDVATAASRLRQATPSLSEEFSYILAQRITKPEQAGVCWSWDAILRTRSVLSFNNFYGDRSQCLQMLKSLEVPTTLIYGDNSKLNRPEDLQLQQITMTQAKQVFLSGGHNLHIDAASYLASLILTSESTFS
ncbi:MAG: alpha/beta fold hydrolase [Okeania sp. SIO3B5]|nr:alpha/beta fold hydrolase [Okeania sp. SIO3B5]